MGLNSPSCLWITMVIGNFHKNKHLKSSQELGQPSDSVLIIAQPPGRAGNGNVYV